jgi:hypothetical protein
MRHRFPFFGPRQHERSFCLPTVVMLRPIVIRNILSVARDGLSYALENMNRLAYNPRLE